MSILAIIFVSEFDKLVFKYNLQMLMKPPSMLDDVISQDSENFTVQSKDRSMKNKNGKKENTIRFGSGNNNDLI